VTCRVEVTTMGDFPFEHLARSPPVLGDGDRQKRGVRFSEGRVKSIFLTPFCWSQSGGLGKHAGRSMKRTMQRRNTYPRQELLAEAGTCGGDSVLWGGSLTSPLQHNGRERRTTGVRSTARVERTVAKVGKVSRVASALPHSEGAAYKQQGCEVAACLRDWRMGS
jgi:hypothetical protein